MITVAQLLDEHVSLDIECVDRLYLNGYVPGLQTPQGLVSFMRAHLGKPVPSPALLGRMTSSFCNAVELFIAENDIPLVRFEKRQRKDDVANAIRAERKIRDGVVFVGVAQEKASAFKGRKVGPYEFDYTRADVFVKHYYFYLDDSDFGPAFIKVCTYAPFAVRVCLNGHEWVKRQLLKRGIQFDELDNGFFRTDDPAAVQSVCDELSACHIEAFFRKWVHRLPFPFAANDRRAGYMHRLSIWQLEFSRTQVFSNPLRGRQFFESVIRENLDLGRPDRVKLVFERPIRSNTPGRFSTRVVTSGVHPSIHIAYKNTELKQYFKLNRALRTETTIKQARDFGIGKDIRNFDHLRRIARNANRRLLEVERVSQDCAISMESVERLTQPTVDDGGRRAPGLKLGDPRVMALLAALTLFLHLPNGFRNRDLRKHVANLLGDGTAEYTAGKMTYDLRRLRLKGIVARVPGTTRYFLTHYGYRVALFVSRVHARILRPGFDCIGKPPEVVVPHPLRRALNQVGVEVDHLITQAALRAAA
jgi:hypothetical protein